MTSSGYPMSIPDSEFKKSRKDPLTSVKFTEEQGGGYLGGLEVFHQVRKFSSPGIYHKFHHSPLAKSFIACGLYDSTPTPNIIRA
jgi:hypothetical protein